MTIHQRRCQRLMRVTIPVPEGAGPRACLEAQISLLISLLDYMDPDPDLEENGDLEGSIGPDYQGYVDLEADGADLEPSLGSFGCINQEGWHGSGEHWAAGLDHELDDCDDEDGGDTEGSCDEDTDDTDDTPIFGRVFNEIDTERRETVAAAQRLLGVANRLRGGEVRP